MITLQDIIDNKPDTMMGLIPTAIFKESIDSGYPKAHEQYAWYFAVATVLEPDRILEIGVLTGLSLASMLIGSPGSTGVGWDNDSYSHDNHLEAILNLTECVGNRFSIESIDSQTYQRDQMSDFDLMHIDGDHSYEGCLHDMNLSVGHCKNILVDDYNSHPEVRRAVDYWLQWHWKTIKNVIHIPSDNGLVLIQS